MIAAFALYLRQKPEQNKNYPETNQADADEGQIAQDFPPYQMIRFAAILKKGGNPLRTAPPRFWTLTICISLYHKITEQESLTMVQRGWMQWGIYSAAPGC
jgi:hypothetical protein